MTGTPLATVKGSAPESVSAKAKPLLFPCSCGTTRSLRPAYGVDDQEDIEI